MSEFGSFGDDFFCPAMQHRDGFAAQPRNRFSITLNGSAKHSQNDHFYAKEPAEYILEEDKEEGSYRLMAIEPRRLGSAYFNPPQHAGM